MEESDELGVCFFIKDATVTGKVEVIVYEMLGDGFS